MKNTSLFCIIVVSLFSFRVQAFDNFFPIATGSSDQIHPAISSGYVVWEDSYCIKAYDLNQNRIVSNQAGTNPVISDDYVVCHYGGNIKSWRIGSSFSITTNENQQTFPDNGGSTVWQDDRNGNYDIFISDYPEDRAICSHESDQMYPASSGEYVVWQDNRNGDYDIYASHYLSSNNEFSICTQANQQVSPDISGDIIVWADNRNGNNDIYGYDLSTQTEFAVCVQPGLQTAPAIEGNIIVWQDDRNGSFDIYGYDLNSRTEFVVCTHEDMQALPAVSDNYIVWQDYRNGNWDIYGVAIDWDQINGIHTCENASQVAESQPFYGSTYFINGADISSCGYNDIYASWSIYIPSEEGTVTISTDDSTFDTVLSVYEACGGVELACNDDYTFDHAYSKIEMEMVKGKAYYIRVAGFNEAVGDYKLLITHGQCVDRPQSDISGDCKVNMLDLMTLASEWLACGLSNPDDC